MANEDLQYDIIARDKATDVLNKIAQAADRTGKAHARAAGDAEAGAARTGKAAQLLGNVFAESSAGALGPLQEVITKLNAVSEAAEVTSSKVSKGLIGGGAAVLGASSLLRSLASRDQEAQQRLQASIAASGKSYADYSEEVEKAVKSGERFGNQASTTLDALNRLTVTTHNPEEALKALSTAQDVAAAKGISLSKAAEVVGLTFNGSTRAGKQFGLTLVDVKAAHQALEAAQKGVTTAAEKVARAQQTYNDKLAIYQQTVKPTLAQQLALFHAHQNVEAAVKADAAAHDRLKAAQDRSSAAADAGAKNVAKLATVVKGQASASADSFSGRLRALGARIEDTGAKLGHDYGGALQTASLAMIAAGSVAELKLVPRLLALGRRFLTTGSDAVKASTVAEGAVATEAASVEASAAKIDASLESTAAAARAGAAGIASSAAVAEGAMESEAAVAVSAGARIRAALAGLGVAGAAGGVASLLLAGGDSRQADPKGIRKLITDTADKDLKNKSLSDAQRIALGKAVGAALDLKPGQTAVGTNKLNASAAIQYLLTYGDLSSSTVQQALISLGYTGGSGGAKGVNSDNPNFATRAANAAPRATTTKGGGSGTTTAPSLQDFLNGIGGGGVANAKADAAGKAAKKAGDAAASAAEKAAKAAIRAYEQQLREKIKADKAIVASEQKTIDATRKHIDTIKTLQQTYADYGKQISDTAKSFSSVLDTFGGLSSGTLIDPGTVFGGGAFKGESTGGVLSGVTNDNVSGLLGGLSGKLSTENRFSSEILALQKRGLNKGLLDQLYQAGPSQIALVDALFAASPAQLQQLNAVGGQLDATANTLGNLGIAEHFGQDAQTRAAAELKTQTTLLQQEISEQKKTNAALQNLAKELAAALNGSVSTAGRQGSARVAR